MVHNHNHAALHGLHAREEMSDNKYNYIHVAGLSEEDMAAVGNEGEGKMTTIVSIVTVTEPKTFPGPAIYVTKTDIVEPVHNSYESAKSAIHANTRNSYESAKSAIQQPHTRVHPFTPTGSNSAPTIKGSPLAATSSSSAGMISEQHHGMTSGAKAGVAFGVLACIGLVAGLILFCVRRKKKQAEDRGEKLDEKHVSQNSFFSGTAAAVGAPAGDKRASVRSTSTSHTAATAPRLSLRPVTQFLPGILDSKTAGTGSLGIPAMSEKPRSGSPQNPFADLRSTSPSNPFDEGDAKVDSGDAGKPVPVTAAGASPPRGPNNVHRVQLEFKPSMDDELELKSGQLVRMLHEYDDGWALCIRMDRSQQGVCPRTCLSKLPVKPRPQGPPSQGRPQGGPPAGYRGPPPHGGNKMMPRPLTPTGRERSSTASGRTTPPSSHDAHRSRSQSASTTERSVSPMESGMPSRKPLPGQAV